MNIPKKWHSYTVEEVKKVYSLWATHNRKQIAKEMKLPQNVVDCIHWELKKNKCLPEKKEIRMTLRETVRLAMAEMK